eukprot:scaffold9836_cov37-Prasinocladus_malaysianus.AAC.2
MSRTMGQKAWYAWTRRSASKTGPSYSEELRAEKFSGDVFKPLDCVSMKLAYDSIRCRCVLIGGPTHDTVVLWTNPVKDCTNKTNLNPAVRRT